MNKKTLYAIGTSVVVSFSMPAIANSDNPFVANKLGSGYAMGNETMKEVGEADGQSKFVSDGQCGVNATVKDKPFDGKCGAGKCGSDSDKSTHGKCGAGKCG